MHWKFPGENKKERYAALYQDIKSWYVDEHVDDRMDCLLPTFVEQKDGYKLKCSAAECRALVPVGIRMANELCELSDPVEEAIY